MSVHTSRSFQHTLASIKGIRPRPNTIFGFIIIGAMIAFEAFNYSTTEYALRDLLGNLKFAGIAWATILAIAFCGIDFAGIARLFTPQQSKTETKETWYLFGAWMLAATMNAALTWWGIAIAMSNHALKSTAVIDPATLTKVIPVFVALMVWVIRILMIGMLTVMGERLLGLRQASSPQPRPVDPAPAGRPMPQPMAHRPIARPPMVQQARGFQDGRPEPTYHSLSPRQ